MIVLYTENGIKFFNNILFNIGTKKGLRKYFQIFLYEIVLSLKPPILSLVVFLQTDWERLRLNEKPLKIILFLRSLSSHVKIIICYIHLSYVQLPVHPLIFGKAWTVNYSPVRVISVQYKLFGSWYSGFSKHFQSLTIQLPKLG